MIIEIPELPAIVAKLLPLKSVFDSRTLTVQQWLDEHHANLISNLALVEKQSDDNDLKVLRIFLRELLMRNIVGEGGEKVHAALCEIVQTKRDLTTHNYEKVLAKAKYRWGVEDGSAVMVEVVAYFRDQLNWNWHKYLGEAEAGKRDNFPDDPLLKVKNIKFKVRDLALSNFNTNYAAFDLHVSRVVSRIGLVAYGWELMRDVEVDFGTNPSNSKNYLFFHRLFIKCSELCGERFTPVDLDRIFWHLGRCMCGATTDCVNCPIHTDCLTGRERAR